MLKKALVLQNGVRTLLGLSQRAFFVYFLLKCLNCALFFLNIAFYIEQLISVIETIRNGNFNIVYVLLTDVVLPIITCRCSYTYITNRTRKIVRLLTISRAFMEESCIRFSDMQFF